MRDSDLPQRTCIFVALDLAVHSARSFFPTASSTPHAHAPAYVAGLSSAAVPYSFGELQPGGVECGKQWMEGYV